MKRSLVVVAVLIFFTSPTLAQTDEIAPSENLVVEGIPKIPASLADAVERYTNFRGGYFASWHPVRREMLIATRFADTWFIA